MKKIVKLNESDLTRIVKRVMNESDEVSNKDDKDVVTLDYIKKHIIEAIEYYDEGYNESMEEGVDALSHMIIEEIKDRIYYVSENYEGEIEAIVMDDWRDWFGTHKIFKRR